MDLDEAVVHDLQVSRKFTFKAMNFPRGNCGTAPQEFWFISLSFRSDGHFPPISGLASSPFQDGLGVTTLSDEPSACHCKGYTFPRWTKSVEINVRCSLTSFDFMCLYFEEWLLLLYYNFFCRCNDFLILDK